MFDDATVLSVAAWGLGSRNSCFRWVDRFDVERVHADVCQPVSQCAGNEFLAWSRLLALLLGMLKFKAIPAILHGWRGCEKIQSKSK